MMLKLVYISLSLSLSLVVLNVFEAEDTRTGDRRIAKKDGRADRRTADIQQI